MVNRVILSKIELQNYRSCKNTVLELKPKLTSLIGINGSGKSNLLNGILLLKKLARYSAYQEKDVSVTAFSKLRAFFNVGRVQLVYHASIGISADEENQDDILYARESWLLNDPKKKKKQKWVDLPLSTIGNQRRRIIYMSRMRRMDTRSSYRQLELLTKSEPSQQITPLIEAVYNFATGISYYSASRFTDPTKCPTSFEIDTDGSLHRYIPQNSHTRFVFDLFNAYKSAKNNYDLFLSIVGKEGIGLVDSIRFDEIVVPANIVKVRTGGNIVRTVGKKFLIVPNFIVQKVRLSPNQLSEGTFKTLALVFYLLTHKSNLVLIEEPEVCIHHGLLSSIVELIKMSSSRKQIIVSTHSDFILDALDPSEVCIVRNLPRNGTVVKHVAGTLGEKGYAALREYLNTSGNLGEYWRHGGLER